MRTCLSCSSPDVTPQWVCPQCGWQPERRNGFPILGPALADGGEYFPDDAHDKLIQVEESSFWFTSRNQLLLTMLNRHFPDATSMLEIGCGTGFVMAFLAKNRRRMSFFGAEAFPAGLEHARNRLQPAEFAQMDACAIPFVDEFEVIGAFDVLEHIPADAKALSQIHKALKPDGGLILTVPQHQWLWSHIDDASGHQRRYTRKLLRQRVEAAGFNVLTMTSFVTLLLPFMLASRLMSARSKNKPTQVQAGLCLPDMVNKTFAKICGFEQVLIRAGVSLPVGGSLLCVARK